MILIIGGSSFIGAYTVQAFLEAGHKVVTTGRNPYFKRYYSDLEVPYIPLDLCSPKDFEGLPSSGIDCVILLAAMLPANSHSKLIDSDNSEEYILTNTVGTAHVLNFCLKHNIRKLISTTSYADVQNKWSRSTPISESTSRDFKFSGDHAAYIISKNAATDLMLYYNEQHQMSNSIFRLPPVYGVGPHGSLLDNGKVRKSGIQVFIDNAKALEPITVFGDTSAFRDIVYVKDVALAFVKAACSNNTIGLYNIGSGSKTSLLEQAETIASVFSPEPPKQSLVNIDPSKPNNIVSYSFDIRKAQTDFGYKPQYPTFRDIMEDWKKEENGTFASLFSQ